ncbi:MAG: aspartate aminotransferase family protein [Oscillospiraceae bacterium]|nr:aspartate aminotransferase family protein [Oscillospiraceae bacterium]
MSNWATVSLENLPNVKTAVPGPKSTEYHTRCAAYMKGYSSQVRLFPVAFESGFGYTLTDVDGNTYIDFSSGIYVTGLGHCHPKISEAVAAQAKKLMNCHDFTTEVKMKLMEKLHEVTGGRFGGFQLYDSGTAAVEAGLRCARAATGKMEFISFWRDFHGKTLGANSLAVVGDDTRLRAPGFYLAPRPNPYRDAFGRSKEEALKDSTPYLKMLEGMLDNECSSGGKNVAAIVLEPVQGWGGSVVPPDDFIPALRELCNKRGILLFADEVLTCMARTGKWLAMDHWNVTADITTMGKGFGNGFPVTCMAVSKELAPAIEKISASSSYGGNPMACAAALASLEVIDEEQLCERSAHLGEIMLRRMEQMKAAHPIIGDVRAKGCLQAMEIVKDRETKEPFIEAGQMIYKTAFAKGLAWVPSGHILRLSPPMVLDDEAALKGLDIIEEAVAETEKHFGY